MHQPVDPGSAVVVGEVLLTELLLKPCSDKLWEPLRTFNPATNYRGKKTTNYFKTLTQHIRYEVAHLKN